MAEGYTYHTKRNYDTWKYILDSTGSSRVLEIGFNLGHSSTVFLDLGCSVHSVEINLECAPMMLLMKAAHPEKFSFSLQSSKDLLAIEHMKKYDLAFIDGDHSPDGLASDLLLAHKCKVPTIVVDDFHQTYFPWIIETVERVIAAGLPYEMKEVHAYDASDGENFMVVLCTK